jgi:hypothetical protein
MHVSFAFADAALRRRWFRGERRPLSEQPIFRFQSLIFAIVGAAYLLVALWSRRVGGDVLFSQVGAFVLAGGFCLIAVLTAVVGHPRAPQGSPR